MRNLCCFVLLLFWAVSGYAQANSYLFVWAGDDAKTSNDFLAVLDADSKSPHYGQAVASVTVPGPSGTPHHTELEMPEDGFLLANAFESGRTMLFDLREPLHPSLVTSFGDLDGYMHPHTYVRLPNGNVLATFQYHGGHEPKSDGGGIVEFDERGHLIRSGSAIDAAAKGELIRPYSLVVVPALDRIVSTNMAMHDEADGETRTVQVWRLSDLKLLRTLVVPPGPRGSEQQEPGEPRLLADGKTVLIHTFSCGLYQLDGVETNQPSVRHLKTFDGKECAVPLRIGHYWVQTLFSAHALATYDISDLAHIREVSRVTLDEKQKPHWIAADDGGRRIVLNSGEYGEHRLFMVNFDPQTGALSLDGRFRDAGSERAGVSMDGKSWPHGFHGDAYPHGTVFSRPVATMFVAQDNPADTERPTGKDAVETAPGPSAATTAVNLDAQTKLTPFNKIIIGKEKEVFDLTAKGDYAGWASLLSDDALAVYDTGYASKPEVLKYLTGMSDFHGSMDQVRVMPIGKTAALIVYRMTQGWKEQGKPMARQYYVSSLWVKPAGKWLSQFWQETDSNLEDNDLSTQALAKEREILETLKHNDWSSFSALLADDAVAIDEDGIHSKQELLDEIQVAGTRFSDYKMENVKVIPQTNGAIVAYRETLVGTEHGKPFTWHIYTHSHWERRGGKWLMTMFQDSTAKE
jgi:hypothetical protein